MKLSKLLAIDSDKPLADRVTFLPANRLSPFDKKLFAFSYRLFILSLLAWAVLFTAKLLLSLYAMTMATPEDLDLTIKVVVGLKSIFDLTTDIGLIGMTYCIVGLVEVWD